MTFSCVLIGQNSVLIECANRLLKSRHQIKRVISTVPAIQNWCKAKEISCLDTISSLIENPQPGSVDYIFSIVNEKILKEDVLKLARIAVFNYHDSLLPRYAGVHATNWALINGETSHGITWHLVNQSIDEGDIVYQSAFPIADNETVLSLNLRCFEEAIKGFSILVTAIENNAIKSKKQDLDNRNYYGKYAVLPNAGYISWEWDAITMKRLCQGLAFGAIENTLGSLKLYCGQTYFIVLSLEIKEKTSNHQPAGKVLSIGDEGLLVASSTDPVLIRKMVTVDGTVVSSSHLAEGFGILTGYQFPVSPIQIDSNLYSRALKREEYWLNQLKNTSDHKIWAERFWNAEGQYNKMSVLKEKKESDAFFSANLLLTAILVYLYRLNDYEPFTVFIYHEQPDANPLFSNSLPITINWNPNWNACSIIENINRFLAENSEERYLTDIYYRHQLFAETKKPLITLGMTKNKTVLADNSMLHFDINEHLCELNLYYRLDLDNQNGLLRPLMQNMSGHLKNVLQWLESSQELMVHEFSLVTEDEKRQLNAWARGKNLPFPLILDS